MAGLLVGAAGAARADAVQSGDIPSSWKIPGTNTSLRISVATRVDGVYDNTGSIFTPGAGGLKLIQPSSEIALNGSLLDREHNVSQIGAHFSSLQITTSTPTDIGVIGTFFYVDAYGASISSVTSSSNGGNLRFLLGWVTIGNWKFGQSWSEIKDPVSYTETLNEAGSLYGGAMTTAYLPLARYSLPTNILVPGEATVSLELNSEAGDTAGALRPGIANAGLGNYAYGVQIGDQQMPMRLPVLTTHYIFLPSWGRFGVAAQVRQMNLSGRNVGVTAATAALPGITASGISNWYGDSSFTGYGGKTWLMLNKFNGKDQFDIHWAYGVADQQFMEEITSPWVYVTNPATPGTAFCASNTPAAGCSGSGPGYGAAHINAYSMQSGQAQFEHWWTDKFRTVNMISLARLYNDQGVTGGGVIRQHTEVEAEFIYSPIPQVNMGMGYVYTHVWATTPTAGATYIAQGTGAAALSSGGNYNTGSIPKSQGSDHQVTFGIQYQF
jgi:hypothetical protein